MILLFSLIALMKAVSIWNVSSKVLGICLSFVCLFLILIYFTSGLQFLLPPLLPIPPFHFPFAPPHSSSIILRKGYSSIDISKPFVFIFLKHQHQAHIRVNKPLLTGSSLELESPDLLLWNVSVNTWPLLHLHHHCGSLKDLAPGSCLATTNHSTSRHSLL